ncbi:MAG: hypothetical protein DRI95_13215 [Bacteroidetes bacterium]|nr:MAG: hypothetical protein DRI95_13215 [Bacteroidota bacterium]
MIRIKLFNPTILLIVFSTLFFPSCAKRAFHKAMDKNTVNSYNKFLKKHDDSKYASKAKILKAELNKEDTKQTYTKKSTIKKKNKKKPGKTSDPILIAENEANKGGKDILEKGRKMALIDKVILPGSCWNWINTVYNDAGYPNKSGKRKTVHKGKKSGPYVKSSQIKAGDWLYYINHSYNDVEHSGIFVYWIDYKKKTGMILSYGGEKRKQPGRYKPYDLTHVYNIIRAVSD